MAKLRAPLLAIKAVGTLGNHITFTTLKHQQIAKHKPTPTDRQTVQQVAQRTKFADCIGDWNALTPTQKQAWIDQAKTTNQTALSLWMEDCLAVTPPQTLERQVAANTDDCYMEWTGSGWNFNHGGVSIPTGYVYGFAFKSGGGMRFLNMTIPPGSTILQAKLKLNAHYTASNTIVKSKIRGDKTINPLTFSNLADYQARTRTTAETLWDNIPAWTAGVEYTSPDFKDTIQEIINLPGWSSGNPIVIFWDDHDDRSTHTIFTVRACTQHDNNPPKAGKLWVEYQPA